MSLPEPGPTSFSFSLQIAREGDFWDGDVRGSSVGGSVAGAVGAAPSGKNVARAPMSIYGEDNQVLRG
jgi:hypothetical protein